MPQESTSWPNSQIEVLAMYHKRYISQNFQNQPTSYLCHKGIKINNKIHHNNPCDQYVRASQINFISTYDKMSTNFIFFKKYNFFLHIRSIKNIFSFLLIHPSHQRLLLRDQMDVERHFVNVF
jgi:hypothetical protein